MEGVRLSVFAQSDVGRVRTNNEDSFAVSDLETGAELASPASVDVRDRGVLMVVSDGMGGHAGGEVASSLVIDSLREALSDPAADHSSLQRFIDSAVRRANADVWQAARDSRKKGMGATLTAVLVHDCDAYVAEVGDSRAYLLRSGRLRQLTKDQSFVQMLLDAGALTPEQAKDSPQKNVILQAMGLAETVQVSIGRLSLRRGDRFLLCSDGVSNKIPDDELQSLLAGSSLESAGSRIIDLANERGGEDNATVVVAQVEGDHLSVPRREETVTQTLEVLQEYGAEAKRPARPRPPDSTPPAAALPAPRPAEASPGATPARILTLLVAAGVVAAALGWWLMR